MSVPTPQKNPSGEQRRRIGQVLVLFAGAIIVLVLICAITVDVGLMVTCRAELQNAVDAAALAGASQLVGFVDAPARNKATDEARALAFANHVAGKPLTLGTGDVLFGRYIAETQTFRPESQFGPGEIVDSIKVTGRRTVGSPDGPIDLFFGCIFGLRSTGVAVSAIGTQPRRYVVFAMDRSGSMSYDTTNITLRFSPNPDGNMIKSPTGWYWMSQYIYTGSWQTAYFYAKNDSTGEIETSFLPDHIKANLVSGQYFRYIDPDDQSTIQSGWLKAPSNVTLYSRYGPSCPNWSAQSYGPVGSCDYAVANNPIEPIASSQNAASAFVDLLNPDRERAGLVTFAWDGVLRCQLTNDWTTLKNKIMSYDPRGSTATPKGMQLANDELISSGRASTYGHKIVILLTDGMANTVNHTYYNNPSSPVTVAFFGQSVSCRIYQAVASAMETETRRAMNNGVRFYTISFGSDSDTVLMPLIAAKTNGAFYYAPNHSDLTDIFRDIFYHLPPVLTQ